MPEIAQAQKQSFDPKDLTNVVSRSISIQSLFAQRWQHVAPSRADTLTGIYAALNFDGTWYAGFGVNTDFGARSGDLGRLYGDLMLAFPMGTDWSVGFGLAGFRYGVFLTGLSLPTPSGDPLGESIGVTDFSGDQFFDDLLKLSFLRRGWGELSIDVVMNRIIEPQKGVIAGFSPRETRVSFGANLNALDILFLNSLYVNSPTQSSLAALAVRVDAVEALNRLTRINIRNVLRNLLLGIQDRYYPYVETLESIVTNPSGAVEELVKPITSITRAFSFDFSFESGDILSAPLIELTLGGRLGIYSPTLINRFGRALNYSNLKLAFKNGHDRLAYFGVVLQQSFYDDPRLPQFSAPSTTVPGFFAAIQLGVPAFLGLRAEASYSRNYIETLQYIAEAYNNNTWRLKVEIGIDNDFRTLAAGEALDLAPPPPPPPILDGNASKAQRLMYGRTWRLDTQKTDGMFVAKQGDLVMKPDGTINAQLNGRTIRGIWRLNDDQKTITTDYGIEVITTQIIELSEMRLITYYTNGGKKIELTFLPQ